MIKCYTDTEGCLATVMFSGMNDYSRKTGKFAVEVLINGDVYRTLYQAERRALRLFTALLEPDTLTVDIIKSLRMKEVTDD